MAAALVETTPPELPAMPTAAAPPAAATVPPLLAAPAPDSGPVVEPVGALGFPAPAVAWVQGGARAMMSE